RTGADCALADRRTESSGCVVDGLRPRSRARSRGYAALRSATCAVSPAAERAWRPAVQARQTRRSSEGIRTGRIDDAQPQGTAAPRAAGGRMRAARRRPGPLSRAPPSPGPAADLRAQTFPRQPKLAFAARDAQWRAQRWTRTRHMVRSAGAN